jgi:23S rRNA U2552 (ribose-2'-O)-methylase RlmE/FtsJ
MFNIKDNPSSFDLSKNLNINIKQTKIPEEPKIEYGFDEKLNFYRNKIDKINPDIWKKVRWYINDYDFLVQEPIINRAFYKYWEIINEFNIFESFTDSDIIFHCCEAPGGFIQGSNIYLQLENFNIPQIHLPDIIDEDGFTTITAKVKQIKKYKIYSISLNKDLQKYKNYNLPSYNKKILNKNVHITYGKDNTGDINNLNNINYIKKNMCNLDGFYLITADGGFDEGTEFNNKEQLHYFLILNEIYSALSLQKLNGSFILKVFDVFTNTSLHLLYLLNLLYEEIYVYKPKTSRPSNSERYIICKGFKGISNEDLFELKKLSEKLSYQNNKYNSFTLFNEIPESFVSLVRNMNNQLLIKQTNCLENAILLCDDSNFITNYELELNESLEKRRIIFKQWEKYYLLDNFILT